MDETTRTQLSKFLSLVLRHQPEAAGVSLDAEGWVETGALLAGCGKAGRPVTREMLEDVVKNCPKQRFQFHEDGMRIRANQGHSVEVDLALPPVAPPAVLFHGTVHRYLSAIRESGLMKMSRQHVHLSKDRQTAVMVGQRRGRPVVLEIRAGEMHQEGHEFFLAENEVWLTDHVPPLFIDFPE